MEKKKYKYNMTQLDVFRTVENNVHHRDFFAHFFRWQHVLNLAEIGMNILDIGCGTAGLFETLYRNRYKPKRYLGIDLRGKIIDKNNRIWKEKGAEFKWMDIVKDLNKLEGQWDIICCFEVLEHIGKDNVPIVLDHIKSICTHDTIVLISTPCFNGVDYADNHVVDGVIGELTFKEMKTLLEERFTIKKVYGTFASIKDYKPLLTGELKNIYERLHEYYDGNMLSNIMAPLFPEQSRNCLWKVTTEIL